MRQGQTVHVQAPAATYLSGQGLKAQSIGDRCCDHWLTEPHTKSATSNEWPRLIRETKFYAPNPPSELGAWEFSD